LTEDTITFLLGKTLHHAGLAVATIDTRLVENGRTFETRITAALTQDARKIEMVLLGYHCGDYGTSVEVNGRVVTSRQLNK